MSLGDNPAPFPGMKTEEEIEELKEKMHQKVIGEVERGDPVEVHVQRRNREEVTKYLTYYGWFRGEHRGFSGQMERCAKEEVDGETRLIGMQNSPIHPADVEKIIPLEYKANKGVEE